MKKQEEFASAKAPDPPPLFSAQPGRTGADEKACFENFYVNYRPWAIQFARGHMRSGEDASDVAQTAFIYLWRRLLLGGELRVPTRTLLETVLGHLCVDRNRNAWRSSTAGLMEELPGPKAPTSSESDLADPVWSILSGLGSSERNLVHLRLVRGLSSHETAHALGLSEGAVRSRLHRVVAKLRRIADGNGRIAGILKRRGCLERS